MSVVIQICGDSLSNFRYFMTISLPSFYPSSSIFSYTYLLIAFLLFPYSSPEAFSQQPGAIGKFLGGQLPVLTPGQEGTVTYQVVPAYPNLFFQDPLVITSHPHENRLFVASRQGLIEHFLPSPEVSVKQTFLDLQEETALVHDGGFLGLVFHPEFDTPNSPNRSFVYAFYCAKGPEGDYGPTRCVDPECFSCEDEANWYGSYLRLSRFEVDFSTYTVDKQSELQMLNIRQYNGTHRGGGMAFGDDGFLYLTLGDQARYATAQSISDNFEGGVIRIDVDQQGGTISHPPRRKLGLDSGFEDESSGNGYFIPNSNPWMSTNGELFEEFVQIGNRSPHRLTKDRITGDIWIGEVGQNQREEVSILQIGGNGGWPLYEGNLWRNDPTCGNNQLELSLGTYNPPVTDFVRTETRSIIGGYVYRGEKLASLFGKYLCGGHALNKLFTISPMEGGLYKTEELINFYPGSIITFGEDFHGELYMGRLSPSTNLYTLEERPTNPPAPNRLSETGAFENLVDLEPSEGLIPYEMIEPFWSDGAEKFRWMALPNDGTYNTSNEQIGFSTDGTWAFPVGTVFIKHFEIQGKRLETRFEVLGEDDTFYYLSYKWNASGTDALLVTESSEETLTLNGQTQVWQYPSPIECQSCHLAAAGGTIGLRTRHLNREITDKFSRNAINQLVRLSDWGLIPERIGEGQLNSLPSLAWKGDETASLEHRARSYLDINCAYCHQPGVGNRAAFDARISTPLEESNLLWGSLLNALGNPQARLIVPGEVENSMIHQRLNSLDIVNGVAMPPLSKGVVDQEGLALIEEWISSMDPHTLINPNGEKNLIPNSSAQNLAGGCTQITPNAPEQTGSAWFPEQVDLAEDLVVSFNLSLGTQEEIGETDNGGDGVTFLFQQQGTDLVSTQGGGSGLGATGISPSVGIEFDTYYSGTEEDIFDDHMAIFRNGVLGDVVAGPICVKEDCSNAEDGEPYPIRIEWKAERQTLKVFFNGSLRAEWTGDMINGIFGGDSQVYIGFTGAVGGAFNEQIVCNFSVKEGDSTPTSSGEVIPVESIGIHLFPNPVIDQLFVFSEQSKVNFSKISIYSLQGQLLKRENISSHGLRNWTIDMTQIPTGSYLLLLEDDTHALYFSSIVKR